MVTCTLPVRIAFSCLAQSLLGTSETVPNSAMVEAFQNFINAHKSNIVKLALEEDRQQLPTLSFWVVSSLSQFNSRQAHTPEMFTSKLPMCPFWNKMGVTGLLSRYQAQSARLFQYWVWLRMLKAKMPLREDTYLCQIIGNMGSDELHTFLCFATGSLVAQPSRYIQVDTRGSRSSYCPYIHPITRAAIHLCYIPTRNLLQFRKCTGKWVFLNNAWYSNLSHPRALHLASKHNLPHSYPRFPSFYVLL